MTKKKTEDVKVPDDLAYEARVPASPRVIVNPLTPEQQAKVVEALANHRAEIIVDDPTIATRLHFMLTELVGMQHSRAAAGGGQSIPWQNARNHIAQAIECIEQQTAADASK